MIKAETKKGEKKKKRKKQISKLRFSRVPIGNKWVRKEIYIVSSNICVKQWIKDGRPSAETGEGKKGICLDRNQKKVWCFKSDD